MRMANTADRPIDAEEEAGITSHDALTRSNSCDYGSADKNSARGGGARRTGSAAVSPAWGESS